LAPLSKAIGKLMVAIEHHEWQFKKTVFYVEKHIADHSPGCYFVVKRREMALLIKGELSKFPIRISII